MGQHDFLQEYQSVIEGVDGVVAELAKLHDKQIRCLPGCCQCCTITSVLAIEAAIIRQAVAGLDARDADKIKQHQDASCPFLVDSLCAIYAARPLICRTHGLPIAYIDYEQEAVEVSVCPLNFSADYVFEQDDLFFIDNYNTRMGQLNLAYCAANGLDAKSRIRMDAIVEHN